MDPLAANPSEIRAFLAERSQALGFAALGCAPAVPHPHHAALREWVGEGRHATMEYMERHLELRADPRSLLPSARTVVVVSLPYYQPLRTAPGEPRIARYALGRDYHRVIRSRLTKLAADLRRFAGGETRVCVDSAPILERSYAQWAGLGWFGKNTLLIDSRRGSWFFLGVVLTSLELPFDAPAVGGCGTCTACIDACPTGAIVFEQERWQVDARRCISYATIEHEGPLPVETHGWTFGCDICQEVCPFNQPRDHQPMRAEVTQDPDLTRRREWPSLRQLAVIGQDEWDVLTQGSPVRRAGLEGLRRNARANLAVTPPSGPPDDAD